MANVEVLWWFGSSPGDVGQPIDVYWSPWTDLDTHGCDPLYLTSQNSNRITMNMYQKKILWF